MSVSALRTVEIPGAEHGIHALANVEFRTWQQRGAGGCCRSMKPPSVTLNEADIDQQILPRHERYGISTDVIVPLRLASAPRRTGHSERGEKGSSPADQGPSQE